jgi:hypothetical protein
MTPGTFPIPVAQTGQLIQFIPESERNIAQDFALACWEADEYNRLLALELRARARLRKILTRQAFRAKELEELYSQELLDPNEGERPCQN